MKMSNHEKVVQYIKIFLAVLTMGYLYFWSARVIELLSLIAYKRIL